MFYIFQRPRIKELNSQIWDFELYGINEYLQYTEYNNIQNSGGHYDWHLDVSHEGLASNRKLSFECILDDSHSGGEFSILLGPTEHKVKLQKGDALRRRTRNELQCHSGERDSIELKNFAQGSNYAIRYEARVGIC